MSSEETQVFESVARVYDSDFTYSAIGKAQRNRVWGYLRRYLPAGRSSILEINCGTGEDALFMAKAGHRVLATDISPGMITVAESKRILSGQTDLRFQCASFLDLKKKIPSNHFDVIFSDFGGLNCISSVEMVRLAGELSALLKPGGKLMLVVMGRRCFWERLFFRLRGEKDKIHRRASPNGVLTRIGTSSLLTWYYSPAEIRTLLGSHFLMRRLRPIGFFIPPSYLEPWFLRRKRFLKLLCFMEWFAGSFSRLADRADHYMIELEKRS
jgi:ubiquinone/menaquinone biosynthesis C-methylase UbiE